MIERAALPGLRAVADQHHELVGMVACRLDLEVRVAADQRAAADQQLGEDRDRVGLGVRGDLRQRSRRAVRGRRPGPAARASRPVVVAARAPGGRPAPAAGRTGRSARRSFGGDLGERGAGGALVADRLVARVGGDQRLRREVVHRPGQAAGGVVDQRDRIV